MRFALPIGLLLLASGPAGAQQPDGLTTDWDIKPVFTEMAAHSNRLIEALDKLDPSGWILKGASETYVAQWKSAKAQAKALADEAIALSKRPEKLSAGLEAYFRLQGMEHAVDSLAQGARKYQDPKLADMIASLSAENGANRNRFQKYLVELAATREQEFQVMDREAQRCRGMLVRQMPAPSGQSGRK